MLLRILGAAGAILLTASLTTASSVSAEEPAAAKLIFNPTTGQIPVLGGTEGTGAIISSDTPCPETHRYRYRFVLSKSDGTSIKDFSRLVLPADNIPILTDARAKFWTYFQPTYPADGDVWNMVLYCHASLTSSIAVATATIYVNGSQWTAETTPTEYHPELAVPVQNKAGQPGSVTGSGFRPAEQVDILARPEADGAATPTLLGTVTATAAGSFSTALPIPAEWATGVYRLIATGRQSAASVEATTVVTVPTFGMTLTPQNIKAGGQTTAALTGFQAGEQVDVAVAKSGDAAVAQQTVTVDAQGAASQALTVPAGAPSGQYAATAVGKTSTAKFELPLGVSPATTTPPTSQPPTSQPPTSEPPTSEPPTSNSPTGTNSPTATDTGSPTATGTGSVGGAVGGDSGGSDSGGSGSSGSGSSGGSDGGKGGGGLASTGAFYDPRFLGTLGAMVMAGSGAVWYHLRRRSPMLEAEVAD